MRELENEKRRMKLKRRGFSINKDNKENDAKTYVNGLIARVLISVILFFGAVIFMNTNSKVNSFIKEGLLTDNMSFTKIKNVYNKYFGNIIPFDNLVKTDSPVFKEELVYDNIEAYKDGFSLTVSSNYVVPAINSGVVVFIGEKDGLGNTVIIQGTDEVDYWYSNIENISCSLYDYVEKGNTLGVAKDKKLILLFKKEGEYLDFDEVVK